MDSPSSSSSHHLEADSASRAATTGTADDADGCIVVGPVVPARAAAATAAIAQSSSTTHESTDVSVIGPVVSARTAAAAAATVRPSSATQESSDGDIIGPAVSARNAAAAAATAQVSAATHDYSSARIRSSPTAPLSLLDTATAHLWAAIERGDARRVHDIVVRWPTLVHDARHVARHLASPVHLAAAGGHLDVLRVLVSAGANINAVDAMQASPLHYAAEHGRVEAAEWLLRREANVAAIDVLGCSPLHVAVRNDRLECARSLLKAMGVDVQNHAVRFSALRCEGAIFPHPIYAPLSLAGRNTAPSGRAKTQRRTCAIVTRVQRRDGAARRERTHTARVARTV